MELFERFLEEYSTLRNRYSCDETGNVYKEDKTGKEVIAKRYPSLVINGCRYDEDGLIIEIMLSIEKREIECLVPVRNTMKIDLEPDEVILIIDELYKHKWIGNVDTLCTLLWKFIVNCAKSYIKNNYHIFAKCGWATIADVYEFKSVTYRDRQSNYYLQDMFGNVQYLKQRREITQLTENCNKFLDFLITDKNLIGIYAYTLHSVLWDFQYRYQLKQYYDAVDFVENKDTLFFSACIYGKDKDKTQLIANLLSNLFKEPERNWCRVLTSRQHISATSIDTKIDKLKYYSSVPIIVVAPKSNHIMKSTKVLKEIHRHRKEGKLFIYPVYLSDNAINVDEMINFSVDGIAFPFTMKDKEQISNIYYGAMELLYYFLCFLRDRLKNEKNNPTEWAEIRDSIPKSMQELRLSEENDGEWLQDNLPTFLLYVALRNFCLFLKTQGFAEQADLLRQRYQNGFIQSANGANTIAEYQEQITAISADENEYLRCMNEVIHKALKNGADWLYTGNEPRGNKETCFYLDRSKWYVHFEANVKRKKLTPISERQMIALLNERQLLKRNKNSSANGVQRKGKYYLAIFQQEFLLAVQE